MRRGLGQFALGFGLVCFVVGCGGAPPVETLVPVGGTLMVNGKPLDGVTVTFIPEISKNNRGGSGTTGADGSFKVTDLTQNLPGLAVGKYTIAYSRMRLPDGSAPPETKEGVPANPGIIRVETLPTHFQSPDPRSPGSTVDIPAAGNTALQLQIQARLPK
jgi:hypothetical protein